MSQPPSTFTGLPDTAFDTRKWTQLERSNDEADANGQRWPTYTFVLAGSSPEVRGTLETGYKHFSLTLNGAVFLEGEYPKEDDSLVQALDAEWERQHVPASAAAYNAAVVAAQPSTTRSGVGYKRARWNGTGGASTRRRRQRSRR